MKIYLLEAYDPALVPPGSSIVSLNPAVSRRLDKSSIPHQILEDHYDLQGIRKDEDAYFDDQLNIFRLWDDWLKQRIPILASKDWKAATVHYNRLKYLVDSLVYRFRAAESFFASCSFDELTFVYKPRADAEPSIYAFDRRDRSSFLEVFRALAAKHGRPFTELTVNRDPLAPPAHDRPSRWKRLLKACRADDFYRFFYYRKHLKFISSGAKPLSGRSVLFLDSGTYAIDEPIREVMKSGAKVYLSSGDAIRRVDGWIETTIPRRNSLPHDHYAQCAAAADALEDAPLFDWVNRECGVETRPFLLPYLKHFVAAILPSVLDGAAALEDFYREAKIEAVISRGSAGRQYPAPLLAAASAGIPRVCFQHSTGPTDMLDWAFDELAFFDLNFAMTRISAEYFHELSSRRFSGACRVDYTDFYLSKFFPVRRKKGAAVYYVPAKLPHGMMKLNTVIYPAAWYFRFQARLFRYFAERSEHFVYKQSPGQAWAEASIIPWLEDSHFRNVSVTRKMLPACLNQIGRAIFDYPSTGFFECLYAGIPTISLYHDSVKIWPPMLKQFGNCLQSFSSTEQALEKIAAFLESDPDSYTRPAVPLERGLDEACRVLRRQLDDRSHKALAPLPL